MTRATPAAAAESFEQLLGEHLDALYRTALRLCAGRAADAEDLVQDAALRALGGYAVLRDRAAGRAWLFSILLRTHSNRARSARRRGETAAADLGEAEFEEALAAWAPMPTPEEDTERRQTRDQVLDALASLDVVLRTVLWLADGEGFAQREVAALLGIPEGTAASRLFRARRALRTVLEPGEAAARAMRLP